MRVWGHEATVDNHGYFPRREGLRKAASTVTRGRCLLYARGSKPATTATSTMPPSLSLVLLVAAAVTAGPLPDPAKLRRIPRIYNALITSDEQLLPSQAYPAVAPVLRAAPITHYSPYALQPQYALYPDPYNLHSYTNLPGYNDTLQDPESQMPVLTMQAQQTVPQMSDQVKNNRPGNREIPDVPPPPLPVSPPRAPGDQSPERKPEEYPPAPPQGLPF